MTIQITSEKYLIYCVLSNQKTIEAQLTAMAFDPEIQREIRKINSEFTGTELDGLVGENISHDYPTNVRVSPSESGLPMETVFLCFQIRSIDQARFSKQSDGKVSDEIMRKIENVARYSLGL